MENMDVFVAVVEHQSLNKASQQLNISQPALSRKIMKLEEELGTPLFLRKGKKLEITRAGQICYDFAREMIGLELKLMHAIDQFKTDVVMDSVTIGASLTTLQATLPDLITMYRLDYPNTDIKAVTGKTHEIVSLVKEKKVDFGLVASKIEHPGLHCVPLFDDHLCLVLPVGHPASDKQGLTVGDLHELPMILFSRGTWYRVLMDELFQSYAIEPDVKMEIDSFEAIIRLVSTCKTATLLPKSYLSGSLIEFNGLIVRDIAELKQTKRTTALLFAVEAADHPVTQRFVSKAVNHFSSAMDIPHSK